MSEYKESSRFQNQTKIKAKNPNKCKTKKQTTNKVNQQRAKTGCFEDDTSKVLLLISNIQKNTILVIFLHLKNYKDKMNLKKPSKTFFIHI